MGKPSQVLLIEDEPGLSMVIAEVLTDEGFHVETIGDGKDAYQRLFGLPKPALVITDINLPRMSGLEIIQAMKQDATLSEVPVIIITGNPMPHPPKDLQLCFKPFDVIDLIEAIKVALGD